MEMNTALFSETFASAVKYTRHQNHEKHYHYLPRSENLKPRIITIIESRRMGCVTCKRLEINRKSCMSVNLAKRFKYLAVDGTIILRGVRSWTGLI